MSNEKKRLVYLLKNPFLLKIKNSRKKYGRDARLAKIIRDFNVHKIEPEVFIEKKELEFSDRTIDIVMLPVGESAYCESVDFLNINPNIVKPITKELERITHDDSYILFIHDFVPSNRPNLSVQGISNHLIENAILFLESKGFTGVGREWLDMFPILKELSNLFWIGRDRFHGLHNIVLRRLYKPKIALHKNQ